jgi:hypothetical protein
VTRQQRLAVSHTDPPLLDFVWPWAVAPPAGAVLAIVMVSRYRGRFRNATGLRRYAGLALDGIGLLRTLVRERRRGPAALAGMTLFWAGEIFALWSGLAAFGVMLLAPVVILTDAIGYVLTRRAAPFGGAGFLDTALVLCLWASGDPAGSSDLLRASAAPPPRRTGCRIRPGNPVGLAEFCPTVKAARINRRPPGHPAGLSFGASGRATRSCQRGKADHPWRNDLAVPHHFEPETAVRRPAARVHRYRRRRRDSVRSRRDVRPQGNASR